jgi:hypothetical protein
MTSPSDLTHHATGALTEALAEIALLCPRDRFWDADESDRLQVGTWNVREALDCAASAAAVLVTPFEADVQKVWRAAALEALDLLGRGSASPPEAYRVAHKRGTSWLWKWVRPPKDSYEDAANPAERAIVGQRAIAFVAGAARVLGEWPPNGYQMSGWTPEWFYPARALRMRGRTDVLLKSGDRYTLALLFPGTWTSRLRSRIAYEAVMAAAARRAPIKVLVMFPDLGADHAVEVNVDEALIDEGVAAAQTAAEMVAVQHGFTSRQLTRTPSTRCRFCAIADGCEQGAEWLAGPGARRFGFPATR